MNKQEFLTDLGNKLAEGLSRQEIMSQLQYYAGYIDGEKARGKSEEEAIEDLGDPILIARNILESPREEDSFFGSGLQDAEDAYFEGSYQGENQRSTEEIKAAVKENVPLGVLTEEEIRRDTASEETSDTASEDSEQAETSADEEAESGSESFSAADTDAQKRREPQEDTSRSGGFMTDADGNFRWDLFGLLLGMILVLTAVIYVAVRVLTSVPPVLIIILIAAAAVFFYFRAKQS